MCVFLFPSTPYLIPISPPAFAFLSAFNPLHTHHELSPFFEPFWRLVVSKNFVEQKRNENII